MTRMEVDDLAHRQLHDLSGGQRQRALVAQGLAQQADILLLDEPNHGLDIASQELILNAITEERNAARTVVMTTHSLDDARRCDRVLLLATRAIVFGPPTDVIQERHLSNAFSGQLLRLTDSHILLDGPGSVRNFVYRA